jgi:hypothetical protein
MDEYKQTVMGAAPFKGDSLELLRAVYRGDYLATHDQIYAAGQCLRFEHPPAVTVDGRSVEEIREQVRLECSTTASGEDVGDVLIRAIERRLAVSKSPTVPSPEVTPPGPAPARHAPRTLGIGADSAQQACDMEEKSEQYQPHKSRCADMRSATRGSPPQPVPADDTPKATSGEVVALVPTRAQGGRIRWIPR